MKTFFTFSIFLLLFTQHINAQCDISNIEIIDQACDANNEYYTLLDFDYDEIGSMGFTVFYGFGGDQDEVYQYEDLPVLLGPIPGVCELDIEILVMDVEFGSECEAGIVGDFQCCNNILCEFSEFSATPNCNDDGTIDLTLIFNQMECSSTGYNFTIRRIENNYSYDVETYGPYAYDSGNTTTITVNYPYLRSCESYYIVDLMDQIEGTHAAEDFESCCLLPCDLSDFTADLNTELCDGEIVGVNFEFEGENFGLDGFTVSDGTGSQGYELGDDYLFYLPSDCGDERLITITDNNDPNCTATVNIGAACCPCIIEEYDVELSACEENQFTVFHILDIISGSCLWFDWEVTINGTEYDVIWDDNVYQTIGAMEEDSLLTIVICSAGNDDECFTTTAVNPCYETPPVCSFMAFESFIQLESCDDGMVLVSFDFEVENPGTMGYSISYNGEILDTIPYPGNVEFWIPTDCENEAVFMIQDIEFPDCNEILDMLVCCPGPCELVVFTAEINTELCNGEIVGVNFEFEGVNFGLNGFTVSNGGTTQGYELGDDYIFYALSDCGDEQELTITDNLDESCTASVNIGVACCPCVIEEYDVELSACEEGEFTVYHILNIVSGSCLFFDWEVTINGNEYEVAWLNNSYQTTGVTEEDSLLTIVICSAGNDDECFTTTAVNPCYETPPVCSFVAFESFIQLESCDDGMVLVSFDFEVENPGTMGYSISYNGEILDTIPYPGNVEFAIPSDCENEAVFEIQDIEFPDCNEILDMLVCCPGPCELVVFAAAINTDLCEGEIVGVNFEFEGENFGLNGFTVSNGGTTQGYELGDDYIFYALSDCGDEQELTITDNLDEGCTATVNIGAACCPCVIEEYDVELSACEEGEFTVYHILDIISGSCLFFDWEVTINGNEYDVIWDDNVYQTIGVMEEDSLLTIVICSAGNDDECFTTTAVNPCYETPPVCSFTAFESFIQLESCDDGMVLVSFDFEVEDPGTMGYSISYNGEILDTIPYPGNVEFAIPSDCENEAVFEIQDIEFPDCNEILDMLVCCPGPCELLVFNAAVDTSLCEGEIVGINFEFEGENFGLNGFTVSDGNSSQGYELGDDYVFNVLSDCGEEQVLTITDNLDESCTASVEIGTVCCPCIIEEYNVELSECEENQFTVFHILDIVSGSCLWFDWVVTINGTEYDVIWDDNVYQTIGVMEEDSLLTIVICSAGNDDECFTTTAVNPCYEAPPVCSFTAFEPFVQLESCDDGMVLVSFDFEVEDPGTMGYSISYNGEIIDTIPYLGNVEFWIPADCENETEFKIQDIEFPDCYEEVTMEVCCPENFPCEIIVTDYEVAIEDEMIQVTTTLEIINECPTEFDVWIDNEHLGTVNIINDQLIFPAFTSENDSIHILMCATDEPDLCIEAVFANPIYTGVNDLNDMDVDIYVDRNGIVNIVNHSSIALNINIYSIDGRQLYQNLNILNENHITVDARRWISGVYIVNLNNEKTVLTKKIFID